MGKVFGNWCSFGPFSIFHQRAATPAGEKIEKSGVMEKAARSRYICILIFFVFSTCMSSRERENEKNSIMRRGGKTSGAKNGGAQFQLLRGGASGKIYIFRILKVNTIGFWRKNYVHQKEEFMKKSYYFFSFQTSLSCDVRKCTDCAIVVPRAIVLRCVHCILFLFDMHCIVSTTQKCIVCTPENQKRKLINN